MIGLSIGILFALVLHQFSAINSLQTSHLPLLGSLFMAELAMFGCIYSSYVAYHNAQQKYKLLDIALIIGNALLAINFIHMGMQLWKILQGT